jgi:hypothetical protein
MTPLLASRFERLGGTEHVTGTVLGLYGDVRLAGVYRDGRLEAVTADASERLQPARAGTREHLPGGDLRGTVPADVDFDLGFGDALCYRSRLIIRVLVPRETEGSVGVVLGGKLASKSSSQSPLTSEKASALPQPMNTLPLGSTCIFPPAWANCLSGWVYSRTRTALISSSSSPSTMPRDSSTALGRPFSKTVEPLSKMVPSG